MTFPIDTKISESTLIVTVNGNRIGDVHSSHLGLFSNGASWESKSRQSPGVWGAVCLPYWNPFQRHLPILQNTINNCDTLCDNFLKSFAEILSQTVVSCLYILYVIIAKYIPFESHFTIFQKGPIFYSKVAIILQVRKIDYRRDK